MAYIALKPIHFNRFYAVSEIIPNNVVDPKMAKRHIEWGNIAMVPDNNQNPNGNAANPENAAETGETADKDAGNQGGEPPKKSGKK